MFIIDHDFLDCLYTLDVDVIHVSYQSFNLKCNKAGANVK